MFELIAQPKYAKPDGRTSQPIDARAGLTVVPPRRRSFWECLFGSPEYHQPGSGAPGTRWLTIDVRCPRIADDEVIPGHDIMAALPTGATNVKVWTSGTRAATPNAFVGAFLVGVTPGGIARLGDALTFAPLWVRFVNDVIEPASLEATLLVTYEI